VHPAVNVESASSRIVASPVIDVVAVGNKEPMIGSQV
jgi:hypothetical protein